VESDLLKYQDQIKQKDLEQLAVTKKFGLKFLVSYDRDFEAFEEYQTPKRFIESLGLESTAEEF
jgi:predicted nucleic acid-binding protein